MKTVPQNQEKVTKNPVKAKVVSVSRDGKTAHVEIDHIVLNERYGKRLHRAISLHVDTSKTQPVVGGFVKILPCRRISKTKSWKIISAN